MSALINLTLKQKLPEGAWEYLQARYSEPHRHYHTWAHIENMLEMYEEIKDRLTMKWAVQVAILYHDVIYDPTITSNESQSAALAFETFEKMYFFSTCEVIEDLILCTKTHQLFDGTNGYEDDYKYFLDMDLASLGVSEEQFDLNGGNIRKEYSHLSDEEYEAGRLAFFNSFLERDRIYHTDYFYDKFEVKARDNLTRSKKILEEKVNGL